MALANMPAVNTTAYNNLVTFNPADPTFSNADVELGAVGMVLAQVGPIEDNMTQIGADTETSIDQISMNNMLAQDTDLRGKIAASNWPTDQATQSQLISLLNIDEGFPKLSSQLPPDVQVGVTLDDFTKSRDRAQAILDLLTGAQAAADAGTGQPTAALPALSQPGGTGELDQAVTAWFASQKLTLSPDWTSALLPEDGSNVSFTKSSLTTPWTFPVPGFLDDIEENYFVAAQDGSIAKLSAPVAPPAGFTDQTLGNEEVLNMTAAQMDANGIDHSLIPDSYLNMFVNAQAVPLITLYHDDSANKTYAVVPQAGLSTIQGSSVGTDVAALRGSLYPPVTSLGASASTDDIGKRYWSDGSNIYAVDFDSMTATTDFSGAFSAPPGTVSAGNSGGMLAAWLAQIHVIQPVQRLADSSDARAVSDQLKQRADDVANSTLQWKTNAETQNLMLQDQNSKYEFYMNFITNALQRWERSLNSKIY